MISSYVTRRLPPITAAAVLTAMSAIACSGSPLASSPLSPSALPAMTLSAEAGEAEAGAAFGALGKGKDKGKGGDDAEETDGGTDKGKDKDKGKGGDAGEKTDDGADKGKGKGGDDDPAEDDDKDDAEEDDDAEEGRGNPHHGAGPHSGTVSMLKGACPAVTFNLKGLRVSTTAATKYVSEAGATAAAACEMLRPNVQVTVTGEPGTASRTFVAATVTIVRTH